MMYLLNAKSNNLFRLGAIPWRLGIPNILVNSINSLKNCVGILPSDTLIAPSFSVHSILVGTF